MNRESVLSTLLIYDDRKFTKHDFYRLRKKMEGTAMTAKKKSNNFLVQGSILAATSLIVRLIGLLYRIPLQRILGDEGSGIYSNTFDIYNLALILSSYSLPMAVSKLVAIKRNKKEYRNIERILKCAMTFSITVGLIATMVIYFGADFFATFYAKSNEGNSIALPLRVLSPTIFVFAVMGVLRGFFQGKSTMIPTAISQVLEQIVNAVVSIIAAMILVRNYSASLNVASYGAAGGTLGTLLGAVTGLLFLIFVYMIYEPYFRKQLRHDMDENRETYRDIFKLLMITTVPIILSQAVYNMNGTLDSILFNQIMSGKQVESFDAEGIENYVAGSLYIKPYRDALIGIYSTKYRLLINIPVAIATAMAAAMITTIAASFHQGRIEVIHNKVYASIKFNMIVAIPSAVGMAVLASPILQLIYKDSHKLPANLLRLGSIAIVFFALSTLSSAILQGIDRLMVPVTNSAISLAIHIVLIIVLLKFTSFSTYALVIGNISFALVVCVLNWLSIRRHLNYHQEIIKTFVIPAIASGFMGIVTYLTYLGLMALTGNNLIATLIAIVAAVVVYFLLLIFLKGVNEEELEFLPKGTGIIRILKKVHLM